MSTDAPTMHYAIDTVGGYDGMFDGQNVLVSAGLAYRNPGAEQFSIHVPGDPSSLLVDSGGFQAALRWNGARAGERGLPGHYPYSPQELHDWGDEIGANAVAGMDVACEEATALFDFDAGHLWPGDWRDRWLDALHYQVRQRDTFEAGGYDHDFMPVIQGKDPQQYERFIELMTAEGLDQYDRVAVGTVCKRSDRDEILDVVTTVRDYFPNKWVHLFGATLNIYKDDRFDGLFDSSDTAAWNWGAASKADKKDLFGEYNQKVEGYATGDKQHRL